MSIISIAAYFGGIKMAYSQYYSVPIREMIGLQDQQPLEEKQPWAGMNSITVNNLESIVHSPKMDQKSVPYILPLDSGRILSRIPMDLNG